jgi:3-phosphoshikimate 1-carboxyvinyltransferase
MNAMSDPSTPYPDSLSIQPLARPPHCSIRVPGSKSLTNRALVLAALTAVGRTCELRGALQSEDVEVMVEALQKLGFRVQADWDRCVLRVGRDAGESSIPVTQADLFVANSGTSMRFLTAMVCLARSAPGSAPCRFRLDGVPRMRERPIKDLLMALRKLGVRADSESGNGCPPVILETTGLHGGTATVKGDVSSQFLSGLLMAAPFADKETTLEVEGKLVSWPYVAMTVELMRRWGLRVEMQDQQHFRIPGRQRSGVQSHGIEPDASAATYFWGAAAITGGEVRVADLTPRSLQGDVRFVEVLEQMGCQVIHGHNSTTVRGGPLHGVDVDMNDISDAVMTLAAVACFAEGPTTIRNVAHIRHKETDRLSALAVELRKVGPAVEERPDGLTITPAPLRSAVLATYNDHRMAMSLALIGLKIPGIVIDNPGCVAKTYPRFFTDLEQLRR